MLSTTLSKRLATIMLLVIVLVVLLAVAVFAATKTAPPPSIDWAAVITGIVGILTAIGTLYIQSPWVRALAGKIQKLAPGWTWEDACKLERILTSTDALDALKKWVRAYQLPVLLLCLLLLGSLAPQAQCQIASTETLIIPVSVRSVSSTPLEQAFVTKKFSLTYFHDGENNAFGVPVGKWSAGKLHCDLIPVLSTGTSTQLGVVEPIGYDIDCNALLRKIGLGNISLTLTPYYGPLQRDGAKPHSVWGGNASFSWTF